MKLHNEKEKALNWWSGGVSSALAGYFYQIENPEIDVEHVLLDTGSHHSDTYRFKDCCEKLYGKEIEVIRSEYFQDHIKVAESFRYINSPKGAPCTKHLKRLVRAEYEDKNPDVKIYLWGYDKDEKHRAEKICDDTPPGVKNIFPLIDIKPMDKKEAHWYLENILKIKRPEFYNMGYPNNNCIGCLKANNFGYWNKIRIDFSDFFSTYRTTSPVSVNFIAFHTRLTIICFNLPGSPDISAGIPG